MSELGAARMLVVESVVERDGESEVARDVERGEARCFVRAAVRVETWGCALDFETAKTCQLSAKLAVRMYRTTKIGYPRYTDSKSRKTRPVRLLNNTSRGLETVAAGG